MFTSSGTCYLRQSCCCRRITSSILASIFLWVNPCCSTCEGIPSSCRVEHKNTCISTNLFNGCFKGGCRGDSNDNIWVSFVINDLTGYQGVKCAVRIFLVISHFWAIRASHPRLVQEIHLACQSQVSKIQPFWMAEKRRELLGSRIPMSSTHFCPLPVQVSNLTYSSLNNWMFSLTVDSQCSSGTFLRTAYPRASVANFTFPRWSTLAIIANSCCIRREE